MRVRSLDLTHVVVRDQDSLRRAQLEAEVLVRTARSEADSIREQAHREGLSAGMAEAARMCKPLVDRLEADAAALTEETQVILSMIEPEVLKLCLEAVEKITRHEVRTDPEVVLRLIKSCLRRVKDSAEVRIRVSPAELEEVRARHDEFLNMAQGVRNVSVIDDRRISPGGCVIETASGDLDATIETQLNKISSKILETYENDSGKAED